MSINETYNAYKSLDDSNLNAESLSHQLNTMIFKNKNQRHIIKEL